MTMYQEGAVDEGLLEVGRRNLRDYFQSEGFFDADVDYASSQPAPAPMQTAAAQAVPLPQPRVQIITYVVVRGARHRFLGYSFEGNQYFNEELLRSRMRIQPAAFASRGRFSSDLLESDVESIKALYQSNGFLQVDVRTELMDNYAGK